jgi:hypothetical protein
MQIVEFSEFARRRAACGQPNIPADVGPIVDPWAALHAPEPIHDIKLETADASFWGDLQFRIAYPTHRMRRH